MSKSVRTQDALRRQSGRCYHYRVRRSGGGPATARCRSPSPAFITAMANEQDHAASAPATESAAGRKIVNLALQGGGSHGAFTWGVLDRLLEESRLEFEGVTGTSAGAVNAVVLADGLAAGGREG